MSSFNLSVVLIFLLTIGLHCSTAHFSAPANTTESGLSDTDQAQLARLKLGLTAVFFVTVVLACGLPIVLINCLQKANSVVLVSQGSNDLCESGSSSVDNAVCTTPNHSDTVPPAGLTDGMWNRAVLTRTSIESEPFNSPYPGQTETTDLLTGRPVTLGPGWSHSRRNHERLATRMANNTTTTRPSGSGKMGLCCLRCPANLLPRSTAQRKLFLRLWFSRCNCFAAGIFLSSGFMELYVDVEETIVQAKTRMSISTEFPFSPFLTLLGFFLVLSIEQIVWTVRTCQLNRRRVNKSHELDSPLHHTHGNSTITDDTTPCVTPLSPVSGTASVEAPRTTKFSFDSGSAQSQGLASVEVHSFGQTNTNNPVCWTNRQHSSPSHHHQRHHSHHSHLPTVENLDSFGSLLRVILLLSAMSVHSLFEGLAVGLQSTVAHTLALFTAILLHKIIIAVGIGVNLATALTPDSSTVAQYSSSESGHVAVDSTRTVCHSTRSKNHTIFLYQAMSTLIFSCSSPLGVLIGWGLMQQHESALLLMTTAVLQGLACGTFFYVVFCELLPEEFHGITGDRIGKLLFLIFGFVLVSLYSLFMPH